MFRTLCFSFLLVAVASTVPLRAQVTIGTPPLGSFTGGPDVINLANLNAHLEIPVATRAGRGGTDFFYDLTYDSSIWYPVGSSGHQSWVSAGNWGWASNNTISSGATGYLTYTYSSSFCYDNQGHPTGQETWYSGPIYYDPWGTVHSFPGFIHTQTGGCGSLNQNTYPSMATDGSGLIASNYNGCIVVTNGSISCPPVNPTGGAYASSFVDRNGNQVTTDSSGHFFDTLSSTVPVLTVAGSAPVTFAYTAPSGGSAQYTVSYVNHVVRTNFGCSGISDFDTAGTSQFSLVDKVTLPDGSFYQFAYETTPGDTHNPPHVTGRLKSLTLPTGGQIAYTYAGGSSGHINCTDGSAATLTRTTPDGGWTYAQVKGTGAASTTTVTDPQSNITTIQFQGIYETQRQVASLITTNTCYNGATSPCNSTAITVPFTQRSTVSTLPGTQQSKHVDFYSVYGVPTESDDYDYGTGSPGALIRKVLTTYAALGNINAFQKQVTVCNGSGTASACNGTGTVISQTSYNYDETNPTTSSGTPQHIAVSGSRGNLTSVTYPTGTNSPSHATYFDTGVLQTSTDSNGAVTTYNFPNPTSTCGNTFPTSITEPLSMSRSFLWNCNGGVMTQVTDENNQPTSTVYNDPYFWRPAQQNYPDAGQISWAYNTPVSITTTQKMNATQNITTYLLNDPLGRTSQVQLTSDPLGTVYNYMNYDALGRVASVYNPTRCNPVTTNCGESTWGYATNSYDALNRVTSAVYQDGTSVTRSYVNNTETVTDQAGKTRKFQVDGLGRVTNVWEDPAGLNYQTVYTYDALGDLTGAVQGGSRNRSYTYDGLSRLTSETNPESGAVSYTYNSNGDLATKIAPTATSTYSWDLLHRLTKKSYSDGTPTANFYYDAAPSFWAGGEQNTVGRLVEATTSNTATEFSYDPLGRIAQRVVCTPLNCTVGPNGQTGQGWSWFYTYNLAGGLTQSNDGIFTWPQYFNQTYDAAGRVTQVTSTVSDAQHPATFFTSDATNGYFPNGALRKAALGNGLTQTNVLDNRLLPCLIDVNNNGTLLHTCADGTPTGNVLDFSIGYNNGTADNGNVTNWNATGAESFVRTYTYDSLNRVKTMGDTVTAQPCKGLSWTYDAWANRTDQTVTSGTCGTFHNTVDTNNRFVGAPYQYDAAGNMTHDASHSYTFDAEGRVTAVDGGATASYVYDALGRRVKRVVGSSSFEYIYDNDGHISWELLSGSINRTYIRSNGVLLAEYSQGTTYFIHQDHLGSTRLLTGYPSPTTVECDDYYPFGEANSCGTNTTTTLKFTGDERDAETNLDHTLFRQYSSSIGRWASPDPIGLVAADPSSPQSWNRYAYVGNNPPTFTDPTGGYTYSDGGGCDPRFDPFCSGGGAGCDPIVDPFCGACDPFCGPIGPIGGRGGGRGGGGSRPASNPPRPVTARQMQLAQGLIGVDDAAELFFCVAEPYLCALVAITAAATIAANQLAKRLVRVTVSCHIGDITDKSELDILGTVQGTGVGLNFQQALNAARRVAGAIAQARFPTRRVYVRHCNPI